MEPARANVETVGRRAVLVSRDLGRMRYGEALELQRRLQVEVIASRSGGGAGAAGSAGSAGGVGAGREMYLLFVEHDPPVITVSRRRTARGHLLATDDQLRAAGVEVAETDRGGDITYHGPGQLVVYPILDLNDLGLRLHSYMRFLEAVVIRVLARYGIAGHRDPAATGVWVGGAPGDAVDSAAPGTGPAARKICAMGVRVSRWVTMHGLALNITTNLDHFDLIVPCGLAGRAVTSMQRELGAGCPSMGDVKETMSREFREEVRRTCALDPG